MRCSISALPSMSADDSTRTRAIARYLESGEYDRNDWPGGIVEGERRAYDALLGALVAEVQHRAPNPPRSAALDNIDVVAFTRARVSPMVRGLFPRVEQDTVLTALERSLVFLTPDNIQEVLRGSRWLSTAWDIANLYLLSVDQAPLADDAPQIVGLSEETTCYVSITYFDEADPFADFVVHEAAHIFHNCRRVSLGLPTTRRKEWLLDIEFRKRETFAYACETYATIVRRATTMRERAALADEFAAQDAGIPDGRVDWEEIVDIMLAACRSKNGWKSIRERCAPLRPRRHAAVSMAREQP